MRRTVVALTMSLALLGTTQPADAIVWSGSCALNVRFNFSPYVGGAGSGSVTSPDYWLTVTPLADLDPTTTTREPCAASLAGVPPFLTTTVTAEGSATAWTCEAMLGSGGWTQSWGGSMPTLAGTHTVTGGPAGILITITDYPSVRFVAEIELVVTDAVRTAQCQLGSILSLQTAGILEFRYQ